MQKSLVNPGFPGKPSNRGWSNNQGYPGTLFLTITSGSTPGNLGFSKKPGDAGKFQESIGNQ